MKPILELSNISKKFLIQHERLPYYSLRDRLANLFQGRAKMEEFWALKDVSFNVMPGESVGIIGRNGAGKSTLLKILSRITPPTKGKIIVRGRIASLLEVGTGFHQELTGRENIFMNGSILGMKNAEIKARFDEIVDFSGTEKFLDTQLKHYSSGMQLRLAFAVAAHLDPEILIIDEVLAVGDSVFQKKCMQKMSEVAGMGRTILFVSHNMPAVNAICSKALILQSGTIVAEGQAETIVQQYLQSDQTTVSNNFNLLDVKRTKWKQGVIFEQLTFDKFTYQVGDSATIKIRLKSNGQQFDHLLFGVNMYDSIGNCMVHLSNIFVHRIDVKHDNRCSYVFVIESLMLKPGRYTTTLFVRANEEIQDWLDSAAAFEIVEGNIYGFENSPMIQGLVQLKFRFEQDYDIEAK